jgi:hypothetical protein
MRVLEVIVVALLALACAASVLTGTLMNFLFIFLLLSICHKVLSRVVALIRKKLYLGLWKDVLRSQARSYLFQAVLRNALWVITGICVRIAVIPVQFSAEEWSGIWWMLWGSVAVLCLVEWIPHRRIAPVPNVFYGLMLCFLTLQLCKIYLPVSPNNAMILAPPFRGEWYVFQGGNSVLINHHHYAGSQKYALDLVLEKDGPLPEQGQKDLNAYQTFGQLLLAPVDGVVVDLENGAEDQRIGLSDVSRPVGNHVTIQTDAGTYVLIAHLQKGSVSVTKGQRVRTGEQLGKCGNSGNTSQPHVHIQAMTGMDPFSDQSKPVPALFKLPTDHTPRAYKANDTIKGWQSESPHSHESRDLSLTTPFDVCG